MLRPVLQTVELSINNNKSIGLDLPCSYTVVIRESSKVDDPVISLTDAGFRLVRWRTTLRTGGVRPSHFTEREQLKCQHQHEKTPRESFARHNNEICSP